MTTALERGEWSAARPGRTLPPGKTRYPLYRRLGGPQGRSGRVENLAPTGIRSPDRLARSQSLYRLSYRAHTISIKRHMKSFHIRRPRSRGSSVGMVTRLGAVHFWSCGTIYRLFVFRQDCSVFRLTCKEIIYAAITGGDKH